MIEQSICALAYEGKNWLECVLMVELVVNSAVADATGMSPTYFTFFPCLQMPAVFGFVPGCFHFACYAECTAVQHYSAGIVFGW